MTKGKRRAKTVEELRNANTGRQRAKVRDMNSKTVFQDPVLCSQFLRNNVDIPLLRDIRPEDIEDVTERYRPYLGAEFEADSVKQIRLRMTEDVPLFLVSLIEHKSTVDYNVSMQLLRYMVCIWTEYAREMKSKEKGDPRNKNFRYPPILPIIYYEGTDTWTVEPDLKSRIWLNEIFGAYIPDFTYRLVRVHDYSNAELLAREDEMSLLMLINKVQTVEDWQAFLKLPGEKLNRIISHASEATLEVISSTIWSLCMKMNMTETEALECVGKVKERKMGYLFENMEKIDIQAERKAAEDARKDAENAKKALKDAKEALDAVKQKTKAAEQKAKAVEQKAKAAEQKAKAVEQKAKVAEQEAEEEKAALKAALTTANQENVVTMCQELGSTKEIAVSKLQEKCGLSLEEAKKTVTVYWKE